MLGMMQERFQVPICEMFGIYREQIFGVSVALAGCGMQ